MCGIVGLWRFNGAAEDELLRQTVAMSASLSHRGPDGDGHWSESASGIALGHRRLAIVDLSPTGIQPFVSKDGRIVVTYNGEIYNTAEIAAELAMPLRGTSDTEVLTEAIANFGIEGALRRLNGIFAFAAYNLQHRVLHLARDRMGVKPLYWTKQGNSFAFASELKALRELNDLTFSIDRRAVASYLRHSCVPAPASIYTDVFKLRPAERLEVQPAKITPHRYWDLASVAQTRHASPLNDTADVVAALDDLLSDSVRRQMISDVPLGAFLSGGIDSSCIVALMQKVSSKPVKTFSIGFQERAFDEAPHAAAVARHLGTEHTELSVTAHEALGVIPDLPTIYDEPFADSSQIPTFLVSRLAKQKVTVALSGDGGDELFAGYTRYQGISRTWDIVRRMPRSAKRMLAGGINSISLESWDRLSQYLPSQLRLSHMGEKIVKGARLLDSRDPLAMYERIVSQWPDPEQLMPGVTEIPGWVSGEAANTRLDTVGRLRLLDMQGYLPDDVLTKVDRASMAVGLEVRVPILDHRVVEYAWTLPTRMLIGPQGRGKWPLRQVLHRYVPSALLDRSKMGFGVPVGSWLRGPLREWADDLLSPSSLAKNGLLDPSIVHKRWQEHRSGRRNWQHALWAVLQFEAWRRTAQR